MRTAQNDVDCSLLEAAKEAREVLLEIMGDGTFEDDHPAINEGGSLHTVCGNLLVAINAKEA